MVTRRSILKAASATVIASAIATRQSAADEPPTVTPAQPRAALNFEIAPGACDTHVHIVGSTARYPFVTNRAYTPPEASVNQLRMLLEALHMQRVVIVQPSFYGTDNSCTLDAIEALGHTARGIAVIDDGTSNGQLDEMHRIGIRGVRLNLSTAGIKDPVSSARMLYAAVERIRSRGWHVQLNVLPEMIAALKQDFAALPISVVFDHFGGAKAAKNVNEPGFDALVELVGSGKAYVKISATGLFATNPAGYLGYAAMAKALIAANPDRILWGSNWPHPGARVPGKPVTELTPWRDIDDAVVLNLLPEWELSAAVRRKILVDNPARLFGY